MNIITTIKPQGISDTMNGIPIVSNDVLWSDTVYTWSDAGASWGAQLFANNAEPPKMSEVKIIKP